MKFVADMHMHTIASTHAYSTMEEMLSAAARKGFFAAAITDHGVAMPGAPGTWYFQNMKVLPRVYKGVLVLRGQEAMSWITKEIWIFFRRTLLLWNGLWPLCTGPL